MVIRTYDQLDRPVPVDCPDDPRRPPAEVPWWSKLDATKTRHTAICPGTQHRVGFVVAPDGHLVYREHFFKTYGTVIRCLKSLTRACENPVPHEARIACDHQKREGAA